MKFGVREICDVTFKATDTRTIGKTQFKKGQPVFMIDTAKTSTLEQATTTVYAQGGKGNSRLIAWEGEKTMTFTVEDALMSPMGLAVLSGAGLIKADADNKQHVHVTCDVEVKDSTAEITLDQLNAELGLNASTLHICADANVPVFGTKLDGSGAGIAWFNNITIEGATGGEVAVDGKNPAKFTITGAKDGDVVKLDFYVVLSGGAQQVSIAPEDFGGYFYVEADTLFRREDTGRDMAAVITLPKVKVQSAFTFTMASSGDPSTFTFTMDAFPGYTYFDRENKVMCVMEIVGTDEVGTSEASHIQKHVNAVTDFTVLEDEE